MDFTKALKLRGRCCRPTLERLITQAYFTSYCHHAFPLFSFPPGSKGQGLITNWGPAAFSNAELSHREKEWQKMKAEKPQAQ